MGRKGWYIIAGVAGLGLLIALAVYFSGSVAPQSLMGPVAAVQRGRPGSGADSKVAMDDQRAYIRLNGPRRGSRSELPPDLSRFYSQHEGVGLESPPERAVRLALLSEVKCIGWKDLHILGSDEPPHKGWSSFTAWRIGYSDMLDEIVYVVSAPRIPSGSIMAMGTGVMLGPPGEDSNGPEGAIILSASFDEWVGRMERHGPAAHGLFIDAELPEQAAQELRRELGRLNPKSDYGR